MDQALLKRWLLEGQFRVYSIIVDTYREKIIELKPLMFKQWLANELGIAEEKINLGSLNSALTRRRKREKKNIQSGISSDPGLDTSSAKSAGDFKFSNPNDDNPKRSTTREY